MLVLGERAGTSSGSERGVGGWKEGGEKSGRDEGVEEEEEVRGVGGRGVEKDSIGGWGGRGGTIEFQRILKRDSGDERELDWWSVEALSSSSRNMVENGDGAGSRHLARLMCRL